MSRIGYHAKRERSPYIETYTGRAFMPLTPRWTDISIEDAAHALSQQCRFSGHTRTFYSVAEHSVRVSYACAPEDAMWGLLHDLSEAWLVDLPSPLKQDSAFYEYRLAEVALMAEVCERFDLPFHMPKSVAAADSTLLATEVRDLMPGIPEHWAGLPKPLPGKIRGWWPSLWSFPRYAEYRFMKRFVQLSGGKHAMQGV